MSFSQTAEYSRLYILDVHGTERHAHHAVQEKGNCQTLKTLNPPKGGTTVMNLVPITCFFFFFFST